MSSVNDDVNRWIRSHCIAVKTSAAEHRAICACANPCVKRRKRKDLNIVYHAVYSRDPGHSGCGVRPGRGSHHLAVESNRITINLECQVIEYAIIRKGNEFLTHLLRDRHRISVGLLVLRSRGPESHAYGCDQDQGCQ